MISIVGLGPGNSEYITEIAKLTLGNADVIYGYSRHMDIIKAIDTKAEKTEYLKLDELCTKISYDLEKEDKERQDKGSEVDETADKTRNEINISVLASGDPSLYGIAKYINKKFGEKNEIRIIPGISSVQYLFAKISLPMNDVYITSSHGKDPDMDIIMNMKKIAMMTDTEKGPVYIADIFKDISDDPYIIVGEMLGYDDECITITKASELDRKKDYKMSVVIIVKGELYE